MANGGSAGTAAADGRRNEASTASTGAATEPFDALAIGPPPAAADKATNPAPAQPRSIGLWGAPGSGKTTFLAALQIATNEADVDEAWKLYGVGHASRQFLLDQTYRLQNDHVFPGQTHVPSNLAWRFVGQEVDDFSRSRRGKPESRQVSFHVSLIDPPGEWFNSWPQGGAQPSLYGDREAGRKQLLTHLMESDGIVYLYDPVREGRKGDAFRYFHETADLMLEKAFDSNRLVDGCLPQHLAVCVTKLDDPMIFRQALADGWLRADARTGTPYVPDDLARNFFDSLTENMASGTSFQVRRNIERYFHPDRVEYFVTSAVGFRLTDQNEFDNDDPLNVVAGGAPGQMRLRGPIHPVNVLQPFLWLESRIARSADEPAAAKRPSAAAPARKRRWWKR